MKTRLGMVGLLAVGAIGIAACGSSSSKSSSTSTGTSTSGGANAIDIYSSLPLQGASSAQTKPMVNGIKLALSQAGNKAGTFNINYQSLDDSTAQTGSWDAGQTNANARKAAAGQQGRLLHRRVQLRCQQAGDPDPQPGGHRRGQPGQHLRRPDDQRAGQRAGRAAEVLPDGQAHVPADRPARHDPGGGAAEDDEGRQLHERRRGQRQGHLRPGPGGAARAREGRSTESRSRATPASTRRRRTTGPTPRRSSRPGRRLLRLQRDRRQRRRADHQGRGGGAAEREDLRAGRHVHEHVDQPEGRRRAAHDRQEHPVHGRHARPERVPGRARSSSPTTRPSTGTPTPIRTRSTGTRR